MDFGTALAPAPVTTVDADLSAMADVSSTLITDAEAADGDASKTKRQLLSCTSCRKRKVKCDRVHPCQACCGRGHPKECIFLTKEKEDYEPIAQSYEIRKLRIENDRLRQKLRLKQASVAADGGGSSDAREAPKVPDKPSKLQQRRFRTNDQGDSLYFGSPGLANVVADFANMHMSTTISPSVTHAIPKGEDVYAFVDTSGYPFGTFWRADGLGPTPVQCLPPDTELYAYLAAFQARAQSCSFPHTPEEITHKEISRFLVNRAENATRHPAMLALIFAALAQGLQNGVYDKFGGQWVAGAMTSESWKGDMYIAAAMHCLRQASFLNRPTLLCIQTLIMIGPYFTNGGRFLDAWALFGTTIRLAHSIGLHRNPKYLDPAPPLRECAIRQSLWWWMLHMDQQYSMTLGRPLGISGIGDCPPPEPLTTNPTILRLSEYINTFTILARQILASDRLTTQNIDDFNDKLLSLRDTLPDIVQFDASWNDPEKAIPDWPLDAQAAVFYGKTHNFLILLNRQRPEEDRSDSAGASNQQSPNDRSYGAPHLGDGELRAGKAVVLRGRALVLESARSLLSAFRFFHERVCAALVCWTMGQQAFNASVLLALSLLHPAPGSVDERGRRDDYARIQYAWCTFKEMEQKGIHKLAGMASARIYALLSQVQLDASQAAEAQPGPGAQPPVVIDDAVMGNTGMLLLEDPGLQAFVPEPFQPLGFQMAGSDLPAYGMGSSTRRAPVPERLDLGMPMGIGEDLAQMGPSWAARPVPYPGYEMGPPPLSFQGIRAPYGDQQQRYDQVEGLWPAGPLPLTSFEGMPMEMGLAGEFGVGMDMNLGALPDYTRSDNTIDTVYDGTGLGGLSSSRRSSSERPPVAPKPTFYRSGNGFRA